ncbi:MAG: type II toxin-antitoxin system RelE/ParE family toxin [Candidatus Scalindua rubra]|uniref:Plasmid stabilization system protein n=1 Tax=Candidatus Scalindua brodae TaxID=237368 RepID=A0A0B0EKA8_9BACT|nr:MAG: Plasmid stabilization system protein [Candidatus Scalindua brodae]MBZ0109793.1 type II toxin-antitoxin system RelE/ParE family toxin [Candidatus Scalindua rubra]TWU34724.1 Plasmid stabilization system protein [Candidatus Brocadiaceae bacterium S225]
MNKYKFVLEAQEELRKEIAYSAERWGKAHARKYRDSLREKVRTICRNPHLYPLRNDILAGIRICTFKGNHIIYTFIEEKKLVVVLAILSIYQNIETAVLKRRQENQK